MRNKKFKNLIILKFILFFALFSLNAEATVLYFQPEKGEYFRGDVFLVNLIIDTERERINAAQIELTFPPDKLEIVDISKGNSIFSFWPQEPNFSNEIGKISLVGGVPLGFEGEGKIISIVFKAIFKEQETAFAEVNFTKNTQVLLNDGLGTPAQLQTKKSIFTLFSKEKETPKNEWLEEIKKDNTPPEPFEIKLAKDPLIFDNKYFIAFQTIDRESGIDHFEVKEGKRPWKVASSPYLLEDQTLSSKILVKAVDKAGNERISELLPPFPKKPIYKTYQFWVIIFLVLITTGFVVYFILKRKRKKAPSL